MDIENTFWNLAMNVQKFLCEIGKLEEVKVSARALINRLQAYHDVEKNTFIDKHYEQLSRIKYFLIKKPDPTVRSIHDKLFVNLLNFPKNPPLRITRVFEDFIQGITYFRKETVHGEQPIYHRLTSCGPGTNAFRTRYNQCNNGMSKKAKQLSKTRIQTCYIERLIYDKLYNTQTLFFPARGNSVSSQDQGHLNWLEQTKADFKTCFPNIDIVVELNDFDGLMPSKLTIIRRKKNGNSSREVYIKDIIHGEIKTYDVFVQCSLFANNKEKRKVQRFEKEEKWSDIQTT